MIRFILIDGKPGAAVHTLDRGLQFGDGLFETMAVVDGCIGLLTRHLTRLHNDCLRLAIEPVHSDLLRAELTAAARRLSDGVIKLIITRGSGDRGYRLPEYPVTRRIVMAADWPRFPRRLRLMICKTRLAAGGSLAGIKHLNRLEQVMACAEWQQQENVNEGLMLDPDGHVIEATSANLFIVSNDRVRTPALDRCGVAGIMRGQVIELCRESGRDCETADMELDDVLAADEVFLTGSVTGIRPVVALNDRSWPSGPVTQLLSRRLNRLPGNGIGGGTD